MNQEYLHDIAVSKIQEIIASKHLTAITTTPGQTGTSFFQGKDRLCKVLKTKRGLRIEINVDLPEALAKLPNMETIDEATAYSKHYGTVRHIYRGESMDDIKNIMTAAVEIFVKNVSLKQKIIM